MACDSIIVIKPGSVVKIGPPGDRINSTVISVTIYPDGSTSYRVAWWDGKRRVEECVCLAEMDRGQSRDELQIGFERDRKSVV